jgi:hypothetical protein
MAMAYWDRIIEIHQKMAKDFPSGENGLSAIRFLVNFFVKNGHDRVPNGHPISNKFYAGAEFNYQWLIQYAKKLNTTNSIPGFSEIAPRLSNPKTFLSANNEMEAALKFHLAGIYTSFIPTTMSKRTPDILIKTKNIEYNVEVSSLNPSDQETLMWAIHSQLSHLTGSKGLVAGGLINKIPNPIVRDNILNRVKDKIDEVQATKKVGKINEPKYATIYIAPRKKKEEIPKGYRGIFRFAHPYQRTTEEKIERKIKEKYKQLFSSDNPAFLFLYSQTLEHENLYDYYDNVVDNMEVILSSYSNMMGLVLTVPHLGFEVLSSMKSSLSMDKKDGKMYLESEIGKGQYENSLLWKNLHSDHVFPTEVEAALENYSSNVNKLGDFSLS